MSTKKPEAVFFDSNVYINLLRSSEYERRVERFLQGAFLYTISKIVLMELWAGAKTKLEENILKQHQREIPLIGFSDDGFILAGQVLQKMAKDQRIEPRTRRRLTWDILIALCAHENSALLVTENESDFRKIQNYVDFEFISSNG
ncbi:MAG: PIN domain-containing protein [Bdellovibrionota bacterium]